MASDIRKKINLYRSNAIACCVACLVNEISGEATRFLAYDNSTYKYYTGILKIFNDEISRLNIVKLNERYSYEGISKMLGIPMREVFHMARIEYTRLIRKLTEYEECNYDKLILKVDYKNDKK